MKISILSHNMLSDYLSAKNRKPQDYINYSKFLQKMINDNKIICLQEIDINNYNKVCKCLENCFIICKFYNINNTMGLAIIIPKKLKYTINSYKIIKFNYKHYNNIYQILNLQIDNKDLIIVNTHLPCVYKYTEVLKLLCKKIYNSIEKYKFKSIIIAGDFNSFKEPIKVFKYFTPMLNENNIFTNWNYMNNKDRKSVV